jgi:hypothetical protein
MGWWRWILLYWTGILTILSLVKSGACQCGAEHRVVGFIGDLSMQQHQLRGTIEIIDDCTFQVEIFAHTLVGATILSSYMSFLISERTHTCISIFR